nr:MAG TPA: glycoside hydrolase family protein [Caudoviricetes sp.]
MIFFKSRLERYLLFQIKPSPKTSLNLWSSYRPRVYFIP